MLKNLILLGFETKKVNTFSKKMHEIEFFKSFLSFKLRTSCEKQDCGGNTEFQVAQGPFLCQNNVFIVNYYFIVLSAVAGGRKCNFEGCDKPQFKPTIENGWYWASTGNINGEKNRVP